jgi:hypothetical protein
MVTSCACPNRFISRARRTASASDESGVILMSAPCTQRQQTKLMAVMIAFVIGIRIKDDYMLSYP